MTNTQDRDGEAEPLQEGLAAEVAELRAVIKELTARLDDSNGRADRTDVAVQRGSDRTDSLEEWADWADVRADASEEVAGAHEVRLDSLEERVDLDEEMIAELQAEGLLSKEQVANLQEALRSSRMIDAAVGIVMAARRVDEQRAFTLLSKASQDTNRKLRLIAEDVVLTGDVSFLRRR